MKNFFAGKPSFAELARAVRQFARMAAIALVISTLQGAEKSEPSRVIAPGPDGQLIYEPDADGNRVPDFSHAGFGGGGEAIPTVPIRVFVPAMPGDSTARIQRALDYVAALRLDANHVRGAVQLGKGRHKVMGQLIIGNSGIVLRGQGSSESGTTLIATGQDRRTLIRIAGRGDHSTETNAAWQVAEDVPVGATTLRLRSANGLHAGDNLFVVRPSTKEWIEQLGMTEFGGGEGDFRLTWKAGSRDLVWDRVIRAVNGDTITLDAPITTALQNQFGGGRVEKYHWPGRISHVGIENLRLESTFAANNPKDENHAWMAMTFEHVQNGWVRQITAKHFAGSLVAIWENCKWMTVQDCISLAPVSEDAGYRRHTFFTMGQMVLFLRCYADQGRHDFAVGHCAAGPNAFVHCDASRPAGDSGAIESWASGVLFDNVNIDGQSLRLANRRSAAQGAGWSAANSVLWQCTAALIRCESPPTAQNWAFGCWGEFEGNGIWRRANEFIRPDSLYAAQLKDRLGKSAVARLQIAARVREDSTNPSLEKAQELSRQSHQPARTLLDKIAAAPDRDPIPSDPAEVPTIEQIEGTLSLLSRAVDHRPLDKPLRLVNGWLTCDAQLLIGGSAGVNWWRGNIRPIEAPTFGLGLTRFVPGRIGRGWTDDLNEVAATLVATGRAALDHNYGLWYDRRRDDHQRVRRSHGDVWPPFYEQPFARSGQGTAWDGLSRYDLTKYNPWYWKRLRDFAELCGSRGLILFHQNYFQHNILEAGAHRTDSPWRSANNVNHTGFPEPPPYAGDKRIFMAGLFYDVSHPIRRALHRAYIRQCLDNFAGQSNVLQFTSAEYTGPGHFVEFWLDTIDEWQRDTGHKARVALSCTKDVQDAILADPKRNALIEVIDFRYWWRTREGLFAPPGGRNLAPRQFERQWRGGRPGDIDLAQMTAEYRQRFPGKAVICNFDSAQWAFLCAGGSLPRLPKMTDPELLRAIPRMRPWPLQQSGVWALAEWGEHWLIYAENSEPVALDLARVSGEFLLSTVSAETGLPTPVQTVRGASELLLPESKNRRAIYWLKRLATKPTSHP
jgi:hypothetical protein